MNDLFELKEKPLWQMTGGDLLNLLGNVPVPEPEVHETEKKYVYGLNGIAQLFGCSIPTANRIKQSGKIDRAIKQIGRKIIVDAELALQLVGEKEGGRRA
ncbi:MAG: DUF3853 family protein [Mangrovibacterium sp.]|nr:DUF3853 family protein [Mangrovibacterium sp.]